MTDQIHNPAYWHGFFQTFTDAFHNPQFWWLFVPAVAGISAVAVRRLLPRWRRLRVLVCVSGFLACASLMWASATPRIISPMGARGVALGALILLVASLMGAVGDEADQDV